MLNKIANLFISLPPVEVVKHSIGDVLYCCFSCVKSFFLCLLTNKGSAKYRTISSMLHCLNDILYEGDTQMDSRFRPAVVVHLSVLNVKQETCSYLTFINIKVSSGKIETDNAYNSSSSFLLHFPSPCLKSQHSLVLVTRLQQCSNCK